MDQQAASHQFMPKAFSELEATLMHIPAADLAKHDESE